VLPPPHPRRRAPPSPGGRRDAITNQTRTDQLDHLAAVVTLETISFGVIPADAEMHVVTRCGFILYDDRTGGQPPPAAGETPHASLYPSRPSRRRPVPGTARPVAPVSPLRRLRPQHRPAHRSPVTAALNVSD